MKYKVLKECVINHEYFEPDDIVQFSKKEECMTFVHTLRDYGFIKLEKPEVDFERWEKEGKRSELAKVIIAPEDYEEGEKKYFTWQEAMDKVKELDNGWRLPTNKEWSLIAWEFGEKDDLLDSRTLRKNLNLELKGYTNNGRLGGSGIAGFGWSSRAISSDLRYAYTLAFYASGVYPSDDGNRWNGFPLRLVKDVE